MDLLIKKQPFFSAIIPTYNRPNQLYSCLQAFSHLDYSRDRFEVIVVDDESEKPLEPTVASFRDRIDIVLITQPHGGPAKARNYGASQDKGEVLVFTDDDCMPSPNWLQALASRFNEIPHQIVGGKTINALPHNPYSTTSQFIIDFVYIYYHSNTEPAFRFFASNNMALPADSFHTMGGFDHTFTTSEDRELCNRWLNQGYPMSYAPEAIVYHSNDLTFCRFCRQHWGYGRGAFRFHRKRAQQGWGSFRPDPKFYIGLIFYPLRREQVQRAFLVKVLLVISQVANAMGFFLGRIQSKSI